MACDSDSGGSNGTGPVDASVGGSGSCAKPWGTSAALETAAGEVLRGLDVALDPAGNAIAVWSQDVAVSGAITYRVWAASSRPSAGWADAAEIDISGAITDASRRPRVGIDSKGNALAVWIHGGNDVRRIYATRYQPGTGWGTPEPIVGTPAVPTFSRHPRLSMAASGTAMLVWTGAASMADQGDIWASRYEPTGGWKSAQAIESLDARSSDSPQVAVDAMGNAMVVWSQDLGVSVSTVEVWARRYVANIGWQTAARLDSSTETLGSEPMIAMDADGNAVVLWSKSVGGQGQIWAARYRAGFGWDAAAVLAGQGTGLLPKPPQVAMDANGNALALWRSLVRSPDRYSLWVARFDAKANGWGAPAAVVSNSSAALGDDYSIAIAGGVARLAWSQVDDNSPGETMKLHTSCLSTTSAGTWSPAITVSSSTGGSLGPPQSIALAANAAGHAVVVAREETCSQASCGTPHSLWAAPLQ